MKKTLKVFALVLSVLNLVSCANWFQGKVPMNFEIQYSDLESLFTYRKERLELEAPSQVFASQAIYSDKIVVRWTEVEHATSYIIERAIVKPDESGLYEIPSEDKFEVLSYYVYDTVYEDQISDDLNYSSPEYSYRYFYRVSAENISENHFSSPFTDVNNLMTAGSGWLFTAPQTLSAGKGKSTEFIELKWSSVPGAVSYEIYRGDNSDGTGMEKIDTVGADKLSYKNEIVSSKQGMEYYYKVIAINSNNKKSVQSPIAMGYTIMEGAPSAPATVTVKNGFGTETDRITVEWTSVASSTPDKTEISYAIYRTSSANSEFTYLKTQTGTSFVNDKNLVPGLYYYYYIQTIEKSRETGEIVSKSGFSDSGEDSANPAMGFLLSAPTVVTVDDVFDDNGKLVSDKIILKWKEAIGSEIEGVQYTYNILYSDNYTDGYNTIKNLYSAIPDESGYISIELEKFNYYKIETVNSAGKTSVPSKAAAPRPASPRNVVASKNKKLTVDFAPNANNVYPVEITWDAPENETPTAYTVYRSVYPDRDFRKVATVEERFCIDNNPAAKAGTLYYYKVVSLNINMEGNHSNDPTEDKRFDCRGYGAITPEQWFREYNKSIMHSQSKLRNMHHEDLNEEKKNGDVGGNITYKGTVTVTPPGAYINMYYDKYSDFYLLDNGEFILGNNYSSTNRFGHRHYSALTEEEKSRCVEYFVLTGNTNTKAKADHSGTMDGTMNCTGMYPGQAIYNNIKVVNDKGGGGYYIVTTLDSSGNVIEQKNVSYQIGEEFTGYDYKD